MDKVLLKDLQAFCKLGIYDSERILGQSVLIQLAMEMDLSQACSSDSIDDTVNYAEVSVISRTVAQKKEYLLIEHLAQEIINALFEKFSRIQAVEIDITKTIVNADQFTGTPAVHIYRKRPN